MKIEDMFIAKVVVRRWTSSPLQIYLEDEQLLTKMSYMSFTRIVRAECPHVRRGHGLTDYCDHCAMFSGKILPFLGPKKLFLQ